MFVTVHGKNKKRSVTFIEKNVRIERYSMSMYVGMSRHPAVERRWLILILRRLITSIW